MNFKIDGMECCAASIVDSEFSILWQNDFKSWDAVQKDAEVIKLIDAAKSKLKRSGGKGKGKSYSDSSVPPWRRN
eukprot:2609425-Karenia_brevis.AAC.1